MTESKEITPSPKKRRQQGVTNYTPNVFSTSRNVYETHLPSFLETKSARDFGIASQTSNAIVSKYLEEQLDKRLEKERKQLELDVKSRLEDNPGVSNDPEEKKQDFQLLKRVLLLPHHEKLLMKWKGYPMWVLLSNDAWRVYAGIDDWKFLLKNLLYLDTHLYSVFDNALRSKKLYRDEVQRILLPIFPMMLTNQHVFSFLPRKQDRDITNYENNLSVMTEFVDLFPNAKKLVQLRIQDPQAYNLSENSIQVLKLLV